MRNIGAELSIDTPETVTSDDPLVKTDRLFLATEFVPDALNILAPEFASPDPLKVPTFIAPMAFSIGNVKLIDY